MYVTNRAGPIEQLWDFLGGDFRDARFTSIVHIAQCVLVITVGCILCFGGTTAGGCGGGTFYTPVEGFILNASKFAFPSFLLLGLLGMIFERDKRIGLNVFKLAFLCSCVAWWQTI